MEGQDGGSPGPVLPTGPDLTHIYSRAQIITRSSTGKSTKFTRKGPGRFNQRGLLENHGKCNRQETALNVLSDCHLRGNCSLSQ